MGRRDEMTRLLLRLNAAKDTKYEREHHKQVQGLIYSLLSGSRFGDIHDKNGYKFFNYSDLFPFSISDLRQGDRKNLLISSPNCNLITYLTEQLSYLNEIEIGRMKFRIDYCKKFDLVLSNYNVFSLITGTPIVTRIHREKYAEAGALDLVNGYDQIYWRVTHPVHLFINQLQDNLVRKYQEFYELDSKTERVTDPIFHSSKFLKQVATELFTDKYNTKRITIIGTNWKFKFSGATPLLQFALDCGLGERNSLGFGLMNVLDREGRLVN